MPNEGIVRALLKSGLLAAVIAAVSSQADESAAQSWPSRPITMVVPFTAGTTSDILARGLAQHVSESLGQPIVIDNRGGGGGNIGGAVAARRP